LPYLLHLTTRGTLQSGLEEYRLHPLPAAQRQPSGDEDVLSGLHSGWTVNGDMGTPAASDYRLDSQRLHAGDIADAKQHLVSVPASF
jgi:hypothetical protein